MTSTDITITLHNPATGQSESMPMANTMTVEEVLALGQALLGVDGTSTALVKDGKRLTPPTSTLAQLGVTSGDLLAIVSTSATARSRPPTAAARAPAPAAASGGLDFSNLLAGAGAGGGSSSATRSSSQAAAAARSPSTTPMYYEGMTLEDAMEYNTHPNAIITLLQTKDHLFKELRFRMPMLASKIDGLPFEQAVISWREYMVKNSISAATSISKSALKEKEMKSRMNSNPNDMEAVEYFQRKKNRQLVNEQYHQMVQEYPESLTRVLMLYINCKINNHPLQAFVDSGAQMTIMSKAMARKVGILDLVDTRYAGFAVGVGTGKIMGKVHIAQLQIENAFFPCSITVMDDNTMPVGGPQKDNNGASGEDDDKPKPKDMEFLLGLDMLKRFKCNIDLGEGKLKFRIGGPPSSEFIETEFLHEKDLDETKGGTKGFNATKANEELMAAQKKYEEEQDAKRKAGGGGDKDDDMEEG